MDQPRNQRLHDTKTRWTAVLEVVGMNHALAKQIIKFLGLLSLPAEVGL